LSVLFDEHGKHAIVIMKDCNVIEESCQAWLGAMEGMMELSRTNGTVKQNKRQIDGDEYDEFILDWE
jgi:tRNA/tmRNA/rRNA uracil-C5-methylase (TrmA/RlmC/RlmD family)